MHFFRFLFSCAFALTRTLALSLSLSLYVCASARIVPACFVNGTNCSLIALLLGCPVSLARSSQLARSSCAAPATGGGGVGDDDDAGCPPLPSFLKVPLHLI